MKTLAQGCSASEAGPQTRVQVCLAPGPVGPVLINTTADLSSQALRGSGWCSRYGQGGWKSPEDRQHFLREAGLGGGGLRELLLVPVLWPGAGPFHSGPLDKRGSSLCAF